MEVTVTIIMPAYNCEKFLKKAVESVIAQTYTHWGLLIIDDCSEDSTKSLAESFAQEDNRIIVLHNKENIGVARTRNRGIREVSTRWTAFLDSDDVWEPDKLERQLALAEDDIGIIYCSYGLIDESGENISRPFIVPEKTDFMAMLTSSVISCSTAMIRTDLLKTHPFNPNVYHEDYMLWMELLMIPCKAIGDSRVLAYYRQVKGSRNIRKANAAKERWRVYRQYLKLDLLTSIYAFVGYSIKGVIKYFL